MNILNKFEVGVWRVRRRLDQARQEFKSLNRIDPTLITNARHKETREVLVGLRDSLLAAVNEVESIIEYWWGDDKDDGGLSYPDTEAKVSVEVARDNFGVRDGETFDFHKRYGTDAKITTLVLKLREESGCDLSGCEEVLRRERGNYDRSLEILRTAGGVQNP